MKKRIFTGLALAVAISMSAPGFADHKDHSKRGSHDYRHTFSSHQDYRKDSHHNYNKRAYRHAYKHGKHYGSRHRSSYRSHNYYSHNDSNFYKWVAGAYLLNELIHHHNGRTCYDRH